MTILLIAIAIIAGFIIGILTAIVILAKALKGAIWK